MPQERPEPGSPADWLRFAKSDLAVAKRSTAPGVLFETLCFHSQQAAEKGLKAVLIHFGITAPRTHNLTMLMGLLPPECPVPLDLESAAGLTEYAVTSRYPGEYEPVTAEEYEATVRLAAAVVSWAEGVIGTKSGSEQSNVGQDDRYPS
jgi:HEPN domain-containing protein